MAFTRIQPLAEQYDLPIQWRPILVGGVFNEVNPAIYQQREGALNNPAYRERMMKDMGDWAALCGIEIAWPNFHPGSSVKAMRGCFVAEESDKLVPYTERCFASYWGQGRNFADTEVLRDIVRAVSLDEATFFDKIAQPEYKQKLRDNTDELVRRGGYGSPTLFLDGDDMYFGNDRLPVLEAALVRKLGAA